MTIGPDPDHPFARARFDFTEPPARLSELGRVHVLALGGIGMSAVARLLLDQGVPVSGSDAKPSRLLDELAAQGAHVTIGHDAANISGADTVVVSSAIRDTNPELVAARAAGLRILHRAQGLAAALGDCRIVAVAGANGKTTTTSLLVEALQACGLAPSFAIGGELASAATNARHTGGDIAVVEADESDGSFVVYRPQVAIVTSVQPDHLDFYDSLENVEAAYRAFVDTIRPGGLLVACADDPGARRLAGVTRRHGVDVVTYGESDDATVRLSDLDGEALSSWATVRYPIAEGSGTSEAAAGGQASLRLSIPGRHNLANAAAAFAAAVLGLGAPPEGVLQGLAGFGGTLRRFETKGVVNGIRVVDDYGHNVGKVAAVVEAGRAYAAPGRLIVVFQPHLYSRTRDFARDFGRGLAVADTVIVMDIYGAREDPVAGVSGALVADAVRAARPGTDVAFIPDREAVIAAVAASVVPGDVVLTLGAGDVTELGPEILLALQARS